MVFQSYYKMPAPQTAQEETGNVAHNGSLIPDSGARRDGACPGTRVAVSVFDWTDSAAHPKEIAFFDRGPVDATRMASGEDVVGLLVQRRDRQLWRSLGASTSWSSRLERVDFAANEIDAAKSVRFDE